MLNQSDTSPWVEGGRCFFSLRRLVILVLVTLVPQVQALTEGDYFSDVPLVMSATRLPQSVADTPTATTVIDRKMIEASGFVEIPDLFRLVPGFQVGLSWRDHHSAVTYHGQSDGLSRRMQVLIDGRMVLGALFGLVDWDRLGITVDDIERIEVVRGPAGISYGSNAFIGAINIVTRDAFSNTGLRIVGVNGSRDTTLYSLKYGHVGDSFDYLASVTHYDTEGFEDVNDQSRANAMRLKGHYSFPSDMQLDFQLGLADGPWGRGGNGSAVEPIGQKNAHERYGNLRLTKLLSTGNEWYLQAGYSETDEDDDATALLPGPLLLDVGVFEYNSNRLDIEFQHQLTIGQKNRAVWGAGYRRDSIDGIASIGRHGREVLETYRVYGNFESQLTKRLLLNAGVMLEDNDLNPLKASPRIALNYYLADGNVLRFSVADSYRQPFVAETFHNVAMRNPDGSVVDQVQLAPVQLEPERLRSYELGYLGHWPKSGFRVELKAFREVFENEMEYTYDPFFPEPQPIFNVGAIYELNGGETEITGIEGGVSWQLTEDTRLWGSYGFAEVDQHTQPGAFRDMADNDASPRHTASLLLSHDFGRGWQISAGYYYLDDTAWILWGCDFATNDCDADGYDRVDARLAKTFQLTGADLKLEIIGQNLGGDYKEFHQRNNFETRGFVRATIQFH